jgi:hypothetical protein
MADQTRLDDDMTYSQKKALIESLSIYPALMIMIFIRRRIGFRLLKSNWIVGIAVVLLALTAMFPVAAQPFPIVMVGFALAMGALGTVQRYHRWCEICTGVRWHTYAPGLSYLERFPWPVFFLRCRRIYRFLDPALCIILGTIAGFLSHLLGSVILLSAVALAVYENALFERMLENDLNILDGLVAAEVQVETVKHFEGAKQPEEIQRTLEETAGIPTGVAPDIHHQVQLRRAKQRALGPDNLATETPAALPPASPQGGAVVAPQPPDGAQGAATGTVGPAPEAPSAPTTPKAPDNLAPPGPDNLAPPDNEQPL